MKETITPWVWKVFTFNRHKEEVMKPFGWINGAWVLALILGLVAASCTTQITTDHRPPTADRHPMPVKEPDAATRNTVQAALGKLPLYFIENQGQVDQRVAYYVQGHTTTLYFTPQGLTFALSSAADQPSSSQGERESVQPVAWKPRPEPDRARQRWVLKLDFVGANPNVRPIGQEPTPAVISYFKEPQEQWKTGLPTYASVVYSDLWPGIDLEYSGTVNELKYTFVVKPGADPHQIRLAYRGAIGVRLTEGGQLEVVTPIGSFEDDKPQGYQEAEGGRVEVALAYTLEPQEGEGVYEYGFDVGAYDRSKPLVIDPVVLVYAGYIGGNGDEEGYDIAVDSKGNAYVTGLTASTEATFPETVGPDLTHNGNWDAFVAKVNAKGTALLYAGYIGGSGNDQGLGIAVDSTGNAYIIGQTSSTEATFPVKVGPDLTFNGGDDAFVAKVDGSGTALSYAGYIGGSSGDRGDGIAVDSSGSAYVTGITSSTEATFPEKGGPDLTYNGLGDAFVAKITTVRRGRLAITQTDSPDPLSVGSHLTYTLTVTNNSSLTATDVLLTDSLPAQMSFVSSSATQGSCRGTTTVSCTLGTINNGSSATVRIMVVPKVAGAISNTASVSSKEAEDMTTATVVTTIMGTAGPNPSLAPG